ncbi:hypothetical protein JTB14_018980 [Gonioctena quinquepunctata]|nr:hypothetical protein JTB14_018980 [Gonioctena quinquepunctata]
MNVKTFYDNLSEVMHCEKFVAKDIYNIDETGVTAGQKLNRVVAKREIRQVGALTSGERGTLVRVTVAVSAIANYVSPLLIFPRIRYQDHSMKDGPIGRIGTGEFFRVDTKIELVMFLKHFQNYINSSVDRKILVLLDNLSPHITRGARFL